ncbi:MAG: hypothetical protein QN648_08080, partial [Nitrososphaeraceae archaeon]|nr:hypothetical protein [Nitrososphaeraceae archaeon]
KALAWKLITIMLDPNILAPWMEDHGFLPTQISIGEAGTHPHTSAFIHYYDKMISAVPFGEARPSNQEYSEIAHHIKEALDEVYYGTQDPKHALDEAAAKSAKSLGW